MHADYDHIRNIVDDIFNERRSPDFDLFIEVSTAFKVIEATYIVIHPKWQEPFLMVEKALLLSHSSSCG
jgi:hypothetical protein